MKTDLSSSFDPRNKVVSFRLSDSEYDSASAFCKSSGFRGMSMLARSAFLAYLPQSGGDNGQLREEDPVMLQAELRNLHSELARLIASLSRIREQIGPEEQHAEFSMSAANMG